MKKLFTKERVILGIILTGVFSVITAVITQFGAIYTARAEAQTKVQEELDTFKLQTIGDIGKINGSLEQMNNRLEDVKGITQNMESRLNQFIDRYNDK